ncbi:MAG: T9SS type A sorting domain-containing protein [Cyclobacteriaceae bacterium]
MYPSSSASYSVTGTNSANGVSCTSSASASVSVKSAYGYISPSSYDLCTGSGCVTLQADPGSNYHWSTGSTSSSITVCSAGTYTVTYTTTNGCSVSASAYISQGSSSPPVASGIDSKNGSDTGNSTERLQPCTGSGGAIAVEYEELGYYPNPASGEITIALSGPAKENCNVLWYDMSGREIRNDVIEVGKKEKTFRLDGVDPGLYLVRIKDNEKYRYGKVIVK